jgi:hypothetical protein
MRCLSTFSGCGWAYGFTFTSLPPQILPQIFESWLKSYLMQVCKPCHYALVEAVEPSNCIPCPCDTYMRCLSTFSGCGWAYGFSLTPLPQQTFPQIWGSWLKSYLLQVCKPCHFIFTEAVEPFKLHSMSLGELAEIIPDARMQTMQLHFD